MALNLCQIGVMVDLMPNGGGYSDYPYYAIRKNYVDVLAEAAKTLSSDINIMPILLPYQHDMIPHYVAMMDGLMVIGGDFDADPRDYGDQDIHPKTEVSPLRNHFEDDLIKAFLPTKKPLLGICAGMQRMVIIRGGRLHQHLPDKNLSPLIPHKQECDRAIPTHEITLIQNTKLGDMIPESKVMINSTHHQGLTKECLENAQNIRITAQAKDGVIEGVEYTDHPFAIGVQWHPEFLTNNLDKTLFKAFIQEIIK